MFQSSRFIQARFFSCALIFSALFPIALRAAEAPAAEPAPILNADDPNWKLDFSAADAIAVQEGGRKKPLQTYAFEAIEQMCGRPLFGATFVKLPLNPAATDEKERKEVRFTSMDIFMSIWCHPTFWEDKPIIHVPNAELRKTIDPKDPATKADKYMSIRALANSDSLMKMLDGTKTKKDSELTALEKEAQLVWTRMIIFKRIVDSDSEIAFIPFVDNATKAWLPMSTLTNALTSPRANEIAFGVEKSKHAAETFEAFKSAYMKRNAAQFTQAANDFHAALKALKPDVYPSDDNMNLEIKYNNLRPFAWAWMMYLCAAILTVFALRFPVPSIYYSALATYILGWGIHVYGFVLRCMIAGRPPVSNMYESVIWVGSGAVMFGLIFELIYKRKLFMLGGATAGFLCLVLMDLLPVFLGNTKAPGFEATINPLQPVLQDNFWLTVHVLTITLSYAAFMLAWALGHITLYSHLFRPQERVEHSELQQFVYRVMQVGVLLLSIGTILGGVWAYYSWGRFWGWDPKETWAFITLMCYLVVLHGRFAGLWGNFGIAFGSVFCFLSVVMAWYGVNFVLGSGLHAYGAGAGGIEYVLTLVGFDMLFLGAATATYLAHKKKRGVPEDEQ